MTPDEARKRRAQDVYKRRNAEGNCALDFLVYGDEKGSHAKRCVFGEGDACARTYDPYPDRDSSPNPRLYVGAGIGAIYGFPESESHLWQLAGWNLTTQRMDE